MARNKSASLEGINIKLNKLENDILELKSLARSSKIEVINSDYQKLLPALKDWKLLIEKEVMPLNTKIDDIYYKMDSLRPVLISLAAFIFILILVKLF